MTSPRRSGPPSDAPRSQLQGALLIGVAVLIGVVLLARGFGQEGGLLEAESPVTTTTVATQPNGASTTTTVAARPPAQVKVLVANGTGQAGVAGAKASELTSKGYTAVDTANAASTATSVIYYAQGYEQEAAAVAQALSIPASAVAALPTPPPFDIRNSNVIVVIGTDQA